MALLDEWLGLQNRDQTGQWFSDRWASDNEDLKKRRTPDALQTDLAPAQRPTEIDYSQGVPMPYLGKKQPGEAMDEDLKAWRDRNPIPPEQLPGIGQQAAIPGLLGPNIQPTIPPGVGGSPGAPAVPALPPPVNVPPAPQPVSVPPVGPAGPAVGGMGPGAGAGPGPTDVSARARPQPPQEQPKGLLQRFDEMTQRNPALLLSLASGFAGAPSFGTGMSRAFGNATQGLQQDIANSKAVQGPRETYKALLAAGVPGQLALAASQNPAILAQIAPDYLATRKREIKTIKTKDAWGGETERLVSINPYDPNDVQEVGGGKGAGGTNLQGGTTTGMFAPGVTSETFNHGAVGEDYLKQFSSEAQAAIKGYLAGNTTQTGRQMPVQLLKMAAQKYGMDIGMPGDDSAITQRKVWANSLGDTQKGVGLQAKGFQRGLEHALSLSDSLVKLGNTNGMGFEPAAEWINSAKNLTGAQTAIKNNIQAKSQALAGEVGKLYSGNTGGGVHERQATQQNLGKSYQSPVAASGGLEATIDLMEGGLRTLEQRRDELFPGGNAPKGSNFRGPQQEATLEKIRRNIAILKGEATAEGAGAGSGAAGSASPRTGISPTLKVPWSIVQ